MRILIKDLQPGQNYAVQFRARSATQQSEWSQRMTFSTSSDVLGPAAVTGLSVTAEGTAFLATWTKVTTNTDGSALSDFKDYEVVVTAGATSVTYFTTQNRFDFSYEMNKSAFGTPAESVNIAVRARDLALNAVGVATNATAANGLPTAPGSFAAQPVVNAINFTWAKVSDPDLKYYRLYRGASAVTATTLAYEGLSTNFTYSSLNFGANEFFRLASVDVFGQEQFNVNVLQTAPLSFNNEDVTPPAAPTWPGSWVTTQTDLSNRGARRVDATITWNANSEPDMGSYVLQYKKSTDTAWAETLVSGTATLAPATTTKVYGLTGGVTYNFRVAARDKSGNTSNFVNSPTDLNTGNDTVSPSAPSQPIVASYIGNVLVTWDGLNSTGGAMESDTERVEVHISTVSGFTPSTLTIKRYLSSAFSGKAQTTLIAGLPYGTVHYIRLVAVDYSGNASGPSTQTAITPAKAQEGEIASINAGQISTGELGASVRIIAGPEFGTHTELTGTGLRVYAEDPVDNVPNEVIRLGTDTGEFFAITSPTGEYMASIDDQGRFAGQTADFAGLDADGDGIKDSGVMIYGADFKDWIEDRARGIIAAGSTGAGDTFGPILAEYGLYEISADLKSGRVYEITAGPFHGSTSQSGTNTDLRLRYTVDGSAPTITSPLLHTTRFNSSVGDINTVTGSAYIIAPAIITGADATYRFLVTATRMTGTGVIYIASVSGRPVAMTIKDMGRGPETTMVVNSGGGTYNGGGGGGAAPTIKKTYVTTYAATWSRTFKGDGSVRTDVATNEIVQGYQASNGNQKAMVGGFRRGGGVTAPAADLVGATISKIEVYLYANHWYFNSGGTALIQTHGAASVPGTFSSTGSIVSSASWPKPGGRWVTLPSAWHAGFANGTLHGVTLGPGTSTSQLYYGRFNGPGKGGSTIPLLRITYAK